MIRCAAINNVQHRHQQPWIKCCENQAVMRVNGVPLCGIHINSPPKQVKVELGDVTTVEKL